VAFPLVGLPPTEHASLRWTHNRTCKFPFIRLKHLKGPVTDPSAVLPPAGCTIRQSSRCPHGEGSTSGTSHRHLQHLLYRFLPGSRAETPQGSLPACASGDVATRIRPATGRPSLFPTPLPAPPWVGLATFLPSFQKERYGLTTFHKVDRIGLGALYPAGSVWCP
jgi:hypothetical protein